MKKICILATSLALCSSLLLTCGCEGSSHHDHDDDLPDEVEAVSRPSSSHSSSSVSGKWSGTSATTQVPSKLSLHQNGHSVSGSLAWPGDTRNVSGHLNGSSLSLHIGGGDSWSLHVNGDKMSGTGIKAGTGTRYHLSFRRK